MVIFCKIRNSTIESLSSAQDLLPLTWAYCTVYSTLYFKAKIVGGLWSLWLSKAIIHSLLIIHSDFGLPCILRCLKLRHHICWGVDNIQDERWAERLLTLHICYACMQHKAEKKLTLIYFYWSPDKIGNLPIVWCLTPSAQSICIPSHTFC